MCRQTLTLIRRTGYEPGTRWAAMLPACRARLAPVGVARGRLPSRTGWLDLGRDHFGRRRRPTSPYSGRGRNRDLCSSLPPKPVRPVRWSRKPHSSARPLEPLTAVGVPEVIRPRLGRDLIAERVVPHILIPGLRWAGAACAEETADGFLAGLDLLSHFLRVAPALGNLWVLAPAVSRVLPPDGRGYCARHY